jgi:ribosomal protein S18 acetylase RimI-like enzyme
MPDQRGAAALSETPGSTSLSGLMIREAGTDDLGALIAIENAVFTSDRISRRSFREFLASPRAILRVAEVAGEVAGYYLVLFRQGTAAARLYSLAVAPHWQGHGLGARLLANAEAAAYAAERAVLRLEVEVSNAPAHALYRRAGYRAVEKLPGYYESGEDGVRLEKPLRAETVPPAPVPFYEQTTEFTCGSACLMMVLAGRRPGLPLTPSTEVRLWRRATTVFLTSGLGGCEPYGLAVTLAEEGLKPEIYVTEPGHLMLQTVRNPEKRKVMMLAQGEFHRRVAELGVSMHLRRLEVWELAERLRQGALAILLVSGNRMFGKRVPHWVLAHGADDHHAFLHDPWVEDKVFETATDAANIPTPFAELDRMWRWGATRLRAAVLVPPDGETA